MTLARRMAALATVAAVVLGGCGAHVAGMPVRAGEQPNAEGVRVALLDPGPYPTAVVPVTITPSQSTGIILEGQRMAAAVVVPSEVDATLRRLERPNTGPVADARALRADIRQRRAEIAEAHRFVAGFSSSRSTEGDSVPNTSVVNLVMQFADPGAAAAATVDMVAVEPMWRPTPIARHREAAALAFAMPQGVIVESFTPHGPYVLYQWVQSRKTVDAATELIAGTLDLQGPRLDSFIPTDPARLADLPVDPTGLLAHTLPVPPTARTPAIGVYSAAGALHFQTDPVQAAELFTAAGVEAMSLGLTKVYRLESATGAALLVDHLAAYGVRNGATSTYGIAGLPTAKCIDRGDGPMQIELRFECYAPAGRYAFAASSRHPQDVRQQTAAQYLTLDGL